MRKMKTNLHVCTFEKMKNISFTIYILLGMF